MKVKLINEIKTPIVVDNKMKTTVPNNVSQGTGTPNKAAAENKSLLEKELEAVNKQLKGIQLASSSLSSNGKNKSSLLKINGDVGTGNELKLWEQKILLMLKLKQWTNVVEEGYRIIGKKGPNVTIYKCILVSLSRLGKFDDVVELLDQWKRNAPKCITMLETKQKMEGYLTAIRSGVDVNKLLLNIEEVIKVTSDFGSGSSSTTFLPEPNWKFRPPPQRHNTFSFCPRVASGIACLYGVECLCAHSKEEMKEWQQRIAWKNLPSSTTSNSMSMSTISSSTMTMSSSAQQITPQKSCIPKEQIPISYRILPPASMYYLAGLVKKVSETKNLKTLLVDSLPDVKIKLSTPASISKRLGYSRPVLNIHKWSFMIASKRPLATVTLLHDYTRDRFAITGAFFFNSKRATLDLVDLHPNNKSQKFMQVCNTFIRPELFLPFNNGWPEWCCYQIDVLFQTANQLPGKFEQDIIFDFKSDPKIWKRLSVTLEPAVQKIEPTVVNPIITKSEPIIQVQEIQKEDKPKNIATTNSSSSLEELEKNLKDTTVLLNIPAHQNIENNTSNENQNSSAPSSEQSLSDCDDNLENLQDFKSSNRNLDLNNIIKPTNNGKDILDEKDSCFEEVDSVAGLLVRKCYKQLLDDLENESLSKENYVSWMNRFLLCEINAREQELLKLSVKSDINIFNAANIGINTSCSVGLFGKLFLVKDINEDSKIGRLVFNNCRSISIGEVEKSSSSSIVISKPKTFLCRVINKTEQAVIILIGRKAVKELKLAPATSRKLDIWLHLDHEYLNLLKAALQGVTEHHLNVLFPIFPPENQPWDFNFLVDNSISNYELDETVNCKQRDAIHAILSKNTNSSEAATNYPVLVTGPTNSGKSYLISRSIMAILNSKNFSQFQSLNRILICTYTNKAADEFITEHFNTWLSQSGESCLIRIYHADQMTINVSSAVKKHCLLINDEASFRYPTLDELLSYKIIIVTVSTCLELLQLGLPDIFSHIFIDECHRMTESESLCPILFAGKKDTRIVVAGDIKLLSPETFTLPTLNSKCQQVTLVDRFNSLYPQRHPFRIRLDETYNINKDIVQFVSNEFYSSSVKSVKSPLDHPQYHSLTFSIVQSGEDCRSDHGDGYYNMKEIHEIRDRLSDLIRVWPLTWGSYKEHSIVVITPYADQALGIRIKLKLEGLSFVDVETLPNVLSKQYRVVLISPVRTFKDGNRTCIQESDSGDGGFFTNPKAVYTALTRAQNLIIVVGDLVSLCNVGICRDIWRQYVSVCRKNNSLLGLPGSIDGTFNTGESTENFQKSNNTPPVISPITRPASLCSQILKKSDLFSSSPNLDATKTSDPLFLRQLSPSPSSNLINNSLSTDSTNTKSESLQKLRNLSSIWNDDESIPKSVPSPETPSSSSLMNLDKKKEENKPALLYSDIWGESSSTGSLGNLVDPSSSIWASTTSSSFSLSQIPVRNSTEDNFEGKVMNNNPKISTTPLNSSNNMPSFHFSGFNNESNTSTYKSPFDLPDVRPMAEEAALVGSNFSGNRAVGATLVIQPPPNLPLNVPNPFGHSFPTSNCSNITRPSWPEPISQNYHVGNNNFGLNPFSSHHHHHVQQTHHIKNNTNNSSPRPSQTEPYYNNSFKGLTSFEIAQANYAYYHHAPRRLGFGYNPPPRMLRAYRPLQSQLTQFVNPPSGPQTSGNNLEFDNFNSNNTSPYGFIKNSPKNFDFFKELDLNCPLVVDRKASLSSGTSSSSQDNSLDNETDLKNSGNSRKRRNKFVLHSESEFPDLLGKACNTTADTDTTLPVAGWIEVRNTKKGSKLLKDHQQAQQGQKKRTKKKSLATISMSTVPFNGKNSGSENRDRGMTVDEMIQSLKEMGFDKRQAIKALQICNRDLERAVEWLIQYSSSTQKKE